MLNKLVCYTVSGLSPTIVRKLNRELYGFKDVSNNGKYTYKRKGITQTINCKKLFNAVIQTNEQGAKQLTKTLRKNNAKTKTFALKVD